MPCPAQIIYQHLERYVPARKKDRGDRGAVAADRVNDNDLDYVDSEDGMALLHRRVKRAVAAYLEALTAYQRKVKTAFRLEEALKYRAQNSKPNWSNSQDSKSSFHAFAKPQLLKAAALVLGACSLLLLEAEATLFVQGKRTNVSVLSRTIYMFGHGELGMQIAILTPLVYMCAAVYVSLFRLGMFRGFYHLVPGERWAPLFVHAVRHPGAQQRRRGADVLSFLAAGNSSAFSLLINASLTCRFAAPMCLNYLNLLHVDDGSTAQTEFGK